MPPRKQKPPPPPPTYPARPMNGGRLENAEPLDPEEWRYRPKWNGRRVLCHTPTMRTWNRDLEEVNYVFPAFKKLQEIVFSSDLWSPVLEWLDLEFLYGRHSIARASIVVLDYVSPDVIWWDRMVHLNQAFGEQILEDGKPVANEVYFGRPIGKADHEWVWEEMQKTNAEWGTTFYEGLVAYEMRAKYPIQLFGPKRETRHWIKYRFID